MQESFVSSVRRARTPWKSMEKEGFGEHIGDIRVAMEIPSTETIKQAVIAGMGISFLSAHTISKELKAKSLRLLHVQGFPLMLNWSTSCTGATSGCRRWPRRSRTSCSATAPR